MNIHALIRFHWIPIAFDVILIYLHFIENRISRTSEKIGNSIRIENGPATGNHFQLKENPKWEKKKYANENRPSYPSKYFPLANLLLRLIYSKNDNKQSNPILVVFINFSRELKENALQKVYDWKVFVKSSFPFDVV